MGSGTRSKSERYREKGIINSREKKRERDSGKLGNYSTAPRKIIADDALRRFFALVKSFLRLPRGKYIKHVNMVDYREITTSNLQCNFFFSICTLVDN